MKDILSKNIRGLRRQKRLTQAQLASKIGVNKSIISAYENQERLPSVAVLIKLSYEFNVSIEYLLGIRRNRFIDISKLTDRQIAAISNLVGQFEEANQAAHIIT